MAKKPPIKKTKRRITVPKGQLIQSFDSDAFKQLYETWRKECESASASDVGVKGSHPKPKYPIGNLLDLVMNQGFVGRTSEKGGGSPKSPPAGGQLIELLDKFIGDKEGIEDDDAKFVKKQIVYLNNMLKDESKNPAYIEFHVPIWSSVNKKTLAHTKETVYGHYRTPDYIKFRNLKAKVKKNPKYAEDLPPADTTWYSGEPGGAKPPMWQALFGKGGDDIISDSKGLLKVLQAAMKMIGGITIDYLEILVKDTGTADEIWAIPHLRREILKKVFMDGKKGGKPNPDGISPTTGNFRDSSLANWFNDSVWTPDNVKESKDIKEIIDADEYAGVVQKYKIKISRRQMRHIGMLCGLEWKKRGETVWLPKEEDGEKEAMDFSKSWRDTLSVA